MRLLEFQAKEVFSEYGISLLKGAVSTDIGKAREDAKMIGYPMVVKSQVPVGGRGKAGGIQICKNADELSIKYPQVMELEIKGERARAILIEEAAVIKNEMYLSLFLNRSKRCYTVIASAEGGVEIESVKNQIIKEVGRGNVDEQTASEIASEMGLQGKVADDFKNILVKLSKLTVEKEAELAEINPLAILDDGRMVALDGKMVTDDNSNYRHEEMHKYLERSEIEERAEKSGFAMVELDGDIAVIGNGAGLVMSTLDMLSDNGGKPACFLDVGGGATTESVFEALTLIGKISRVRGILVNLYGGIVKTTTVAAAFIEAYEKSVIDVPVFARLRGAESEKAKIMLADTRTKMYNIVEEAINAAVMETRK